MTQWVQLVWAQAIQEKRVKRKRIGKGEQDALFNHIYAVNDDFFSTCNTPSTIQNAVWQTEWKSKDLLLQSLCPSGGDKINKKITE